MALTQEQAAEVEELYQHCCRGVVRKSYLPEYNIWWGMQYRCYDPKHHSYHHYGGRGITVCEAWRKSFWAFLRDVGMRPTMYGFRISLDRINNNGNYEPGNCRWATDSEQSCNRRPELNPKGEQCSNAKLTWEQVHEIRALRGIVSVADVASDYGIDKAQISRIMPNKMWVDDNAPPDPGPCSRQLGTSVALTETQVAEIKLLLDGYQSQTEIARMYHVSPQAISKIKLGRFWGHVNPTNSVNTTPRTMETENETKSQ